jgi:hypothetical protein
MADVELLAGALQELAVALGAGLTIGVGAALASRLSRRSYAGAIKEEGTDGDWQLKDLAKAKAGDRAFVALRRFSRRALEKVRGAPGLTPMWPPGTVCSMCDLEHQLEHEYQKASVRSDSGQVVYWCAPGQGPASLPKYIPWRKLEMALVLMLRDVEAGTARDFRTR